MRLFLLLPLLLGFSVPAIAHNIINGEPPAPSVEEPIFIDETEEGENNLCGDDYDCSNVE